MITKPLRAITIEHSPDGFSVCFHRRMPHDMQRHWYNKVSQMRAMTIMNALHIRNATTRPYIAYKTLAIYYWIPQRDII